MALYCIITRLYLLDPVFDDIFSIALLMNYIISCHALFKESVPSAASSSTSAAFYFSKVHFNTNLETIGLATKRILTCLQSDINDLMCL